MTVYYILYFCANNIVNKCMVSTKRLNTWVFNMLVFFTKMLILQKEGQTDFIVSKATFSEKTC